jgi:hypothetical protein
MLLLQGPYGLFDSGVWIKLVVLDPTKFDKSRLICVLMDYSCHVPAMQKIYNCLFYSGEYSCILQRNWFVDHHMNVAHRMLGLGIKLEVLKVINVLGENNTQSVFFKVNNLTSTDCDPINDYEPVNVPDHYKEAVLLLTS